MFKTDPIRPLKLRTQCRISEPRLTDIQPSADTAYRNASSKHRLEILFADYFKPLVASLGAQFGAGPPDPEDIAQHAFEKLAERSDLSDITHIKAFLWRTGRNLALKGKRSENVRTRRDYDVEQIFFPSLGDDLTPERVLCAKEQLSLVKDVLSAMPERRRRAFILHRIEGLNFSDVARRLGVSRTAAIKHVARASADIDAALSGD